MKILMVSICLAFLGLISCSKENSTCIDMDRADPNMACPYHLAPVCGCNGETYPNECAAESAGVLSWTNGECN